MGIAQLDIVHMISNAGPMVQFVMLLLLFFSIMSWAIILIKYRYIRKAYKESAEFIQCLCQSQAASRQPPGTNFQDRLCRTKENEPIDGSSQSGRSGPE